MGSKWWESEICNLFLKFNFEFHGNRDVNNDIMEMLIMAYACKTSSARKIIGVMPYLPYCKQSKMRKRGSIVSKLLATMMSRAGKFYTHMYALTTYTVRLM